MRPVQLHVSRVLAGDMVQKLDGTRRPRHPVVLVLAQLGPLGIECLGPVNADGLSTILTYKDGLFRRFNKRRQKCV